MHMLDGAALLVVHVAAVGVLVTSTASATSSDVTSTSLPHGDTALSRLVCERLVTLAIEEALRMRVGQLDIWLVTLTWTPLEPPLTCHLPL